MSFPVAEIVAWTGGRIVNEEFLDRTQEQIRVVRPAPLGVSTPEDAAFFFSKDYQAELLTAKAGVLITGEQFVSPLKAAGLPLWKTTAVIACADPYLAMAILSEKFASALSTVAHVTPPARSFVHPSAFVHPEADLGTRVSIGPHCTVEKGAVIGDGTVLYHGCYAGERARIGKNCVLFPNVALYEWTVLGDRVRLHAGVVLGADGFGYAPRRSDGKIEGHQKIYHLGRVVVGNDVEIGANSCVDRSTFGDTVIGSGAKLDNQVHIGHNARVGDGAVICGGTCLAGRASVGKFAYIGGMTGVSNQVHVGDGAQVGAMTLLTKDVPAGGTAVGNPQREYREHFKVHARLNRLCAEKRGKDHG